MASLPDDDIGWPTVKPPLKWAGGKRWLVPHLRALWRGYTRRRLVEPFCGGLCDRARAQSPSGPAQRRQPAPDQLLSPPAAWTRRQDPDEKRRRPLLPASCRIQPHNRDAARTREPQGGGAVLLPQPHRVQRTVPLQSEGGVQTSRSDATARSPTSTISGRTRSRSHAGSSPTAISSRSRCHRRTSSTPTRPTTSSSATIRATASTGAHRSVSRPG